MSFPAQIELLETLGEGSFGVVGLARLQEGPLKRSVVLKILKQDWAEDERVLTRARDEARLLALLNHDSIVKVERLETLGGKTVVVMEYVQGLSLDLILANLGPLPPRVALQIIAKVAGALDAAYNRTPTGEREPLRVVHRDIKPSNIIVSISGAVKVLDFGTARGSWDSREASTDVDMGMGTLLYMAPECFDGVEPGPELDVYALGATLYELLAGVRLGKLSVDPLRHDLQRADRVQRLRPAGLMQAPEALVAVRTVVDRCIRYKREERPSAAELRDLCRKALYRLPTQRPTLDLYAETCVEPLWQRRPKRPPLSLEGTLDISGERSLEIPATRPFDATRMQGQRTDGSERPLRHEAAQPELAPSGEGIAPLGAETPAPWTSIAPAPKTAAPPVEEDEELPVRLPWIFLIGVVGVLLGLAGILGAEDLLGESAEAAPEQVEARTWGRPAQAGMSLRRSRSAPERVPLENPAPETTAPDGPGDEPPKMGGPEAEAPPPAKEPASPEAAPAAAKSEATKPRPPAASTLSAPRRAVEVLPFPIRPVQVDERAHAMGEPIHLSLGEHQLRYADEADAPSCSFTVTETTTAVHVKPGEGAPRCLVR